MAASLFYLETAAINLIIEAPSGSVAVCSRPAHVSADKVCRRVSLLICIGLFASEKLPILVFPFTWRECGQDGLCAEDFPRSGVRVPSCSSCAPCVVMGEGLPRCRADLIRRGRSVSGPGAVCPLAPGLEPRRVWSPLVLGRIRVQESSARPRLYGHS